MKKILVVLVVLACAVSAFAFKNSITVNTVPFGIQFITTSQEDVDAINSTYGIGADIFYQRFFVKGLFVEGGFMWNTFLLKGKLTPTTNLAAYVGAGYKVQFTKVFSLFAMVDFIEDTLYYQKMNSESFGVKTGIGVGFNFGERITLKATCNGTFSFSKGVEYHYVDYRILPSMGICINL